MSFSYQIKGTLLITVIKKFLPPPPPPVEVKFLHEKLYSEGFGNSFSLNGLNVPKFQLVVASAQFLFASKCYARFFCFELDKKEEF